LSQLSWRTGLIGAAIILVAFAAALWALNIVWPTSSGHRPADTSVPPLAPVTRTSVAIAPVAIRLDAIRDALEAKAPREFTGKAEVPPNPLLGNADFGWSVARGSLTVKGAPERLSVSSSLDGSFRASGQLGGDARDLSTGISNLISGFLGGSPAPPNSQPQPRIQSNDTEQRAEIRGSTTVSAKPQLMKEWRIDPNLEAQVTLENASLSFMGVRLNIPDQVKPLLERAVDEQVMTLQSHLRSDPFIEVAARQEWARTCRSISLGASAPGMPNLWLEVKPVRAFAAQPRIDERAVTLTLGMQSETRIVPNETKPDCPFPEELEIVREPDQGRFSLAVPIDIPFTEASRTLTAQLKGKVFPEDKTSAFTATINSVDIAASGDRLLISVGLRANENKSWFGFGASATIYLWGRPALDPERQVLRLNDFTLDIQSEAVFSVLGIAARAAVPYLEKLLAENSVIEIAPIAGIARKSIDAVVAEFQQRSDEVRVDARVEDLRLTGLEYDSKTLRVIAEADGTVRAEVTKLALQ
jgi:Domain of unknown function (DUF4403)